MTVTSRIEIELTSKQSDDLWTWRAAGAKQPKGTLASSLLYKDAKPGDVCKAEADFGVDGIEIVAVSAPVAKENRAAGHITVVGSKRDFSPVTTQLRTKQPNKRRRSERGERGDKGEPGKRGERDGQRGRTSREREAGRDRRDRDGRDKRDRRQSRPDGPPPKRFTPLKPGDAHRQNVLNELAPEYRAIAEKVLRGGIPAVRDAVKKANEAAKAEGRAELNLENMVSIAEEVLPKLRAAEWQDRAEAAKASLEDVSLRDLRSVVDGADAVARTDEARVLAAELREALDRRSKEARETWTTDMTKALEDGRTVRALRLASRPPEAGASISPELLEKLSTAAGESMSPETPSDRWITLIDAVSHSPVRRSVTPQGFPTEPTEALLAAAKEAVGRIPALGKMLGLSVPPPPRAKPKPPPKTEESAS